MGDRKRFYRASAHDEARARGTRIYPYLLRGVQVTRPNQVWAMDITYIPMERGFVYLAVVLDWFSRRVLSWSVSITMEAAFCVETLENALSRHGKPEIFNTDQGSQFTGAAFTGVLIKNGIAVSMDGKGAWRDNVFVERLWRSVKYEEVYLRAYDTASEARASIGRYLDFYNRRRPHSSLDGTTPDHAYSTPLLLSARQPNLSAEVLHLSTREKLFRQPGPPQAQPMQNLKPSPDTPYTFSIGDVHGCDAALARLLDVCHSWDGNCQNRFVFLGDYADRGPDSALVIGRLMSFQKARPGRVTCLRGNHEEMLLHAYRGPISYDRWISNGGLPTLRSFGVELTDRYPQRFVDFLWLPGLSTSFDDGRRFFVHAGVDLERPLNEQLPEVLTWMREPFLTLADSVDPGRLIVHGHTPTQNRQPDLRRHRLNLDTGAVMGGPLTAAVFSDNQTGPLCFLTDSGDIETL